jgi:flavin-dependent dehydrogenase
MLVEKRSEVGSHILSGAIIEPKALNELIPDWKRGLLSKLRPQKIKCTF